MPFFSVHTDSNIHHKNRPRITNRPGEDEIPLHKGPTSINNVVHKIQCRTFLLPFCRNARVATTCFETSDHPLASFFLTTNPVFFPPETLPPASSRPPPPPPARNFPRPLFAYLYKCAYPPPAHFIRFFKVVLNCCDERKSPRLRVSVPTFSVPPPSDQPL